MSSICVTYGISILKTDTFFLKHTKKIQLLSKLGLLYKFYFLVVYTLFWFCQFICIFVLNELKLLGSLAVSIYLSIFFLWYGESNLELCTWQEGSPPLSYIPSPQNNYICMLDFCKKSIIFSIRENFYRNRLLNFNICLYIQICSYICIYKIYFMNTCI